MIRGRHIRVPPAVRRSLIQHALRDRPLECCGFLLGSRGEVTFAVPMPNVEASAVRYRIDDHAHIEMRRLLRSFIPALTIQGVYHSHPASEPVPSPTDIAEALYPEWIHVIVGLGGGRPRIGAFRIRNGTASPLSLR